jgi:DNA-nicking Smr family endonuclease
MSREHAFAQLERHMQRAYARHARLVLVITGKGKTGANAFPTPLNGLLRTALPGWLETPALRPFIAAVRPAHPRHGGAGAFYVVLRRQRGS